MVYLPPFEISRKIRQHGCQTSEQWICLTIRLVYFTLWLFDYRIETNKKAVTFQDNTMFLSFLNKT